MKLRLEFSIIIPLFKLKFLLQFLQKKRSLEFLKENSLEWQNLQVKSVDNHLDLK